MRHRFFLTLAWLFLLRPGVGALEPPQSTSDTVAEVRMTTSSPRAASTSRSATGSPSQEGLTVGGLGLKQTIEFGPRWRSVEGNEKVYRSHVNLGTGLKLLHSSFEATAPESRGRLFDRLAVELDNWGGDPYNTVDVSLKKNLAYDLRYRYQKIDYFTFIPDFANPLFGRGIFFDQHSYDSTRRTSSVRLKLFPESDRFRAHFSYTRNAAFGPAFTTVNLGGDEFLIRRLIKNRVNDYRIGFDVWLTKIRLSVEQGFRQFGDDQGNVLPGKLNLGNDPGLIFDLEQLFLTDFLRGYFVRGTTPITRLGLTSHRLRRIAFTARLTYSDAEIDYRFAQSFAGLVLNRETSIFASDGLSRNRARPTKPSTIADGTLRAAVARRLTVTNTFRAAHFTIAGSRLLTERFTDREAPDVPVQREETSFRRTRLLSLMNQLEGEVAFTTNLIVRGGYRMEHRDVLIAQSDLGFDTISGPDVPSLNRHRREESEQTTHTLLVGLSYRWRRLLRLALDYENGGYVTEFTGVGPRDYQRGRGRVTLRPNDRWLVTASGSLTDQTRPSRALALVRTFRNQNRSRSGGVSVSWLPRERLSLDADYTRSHNTAQVALIDVLAGGAPRPPLAYREDSHITHAGATVAVYKDARIALGYGLVRSRGSLPLQFHRPYARLNIPLHRTFSVNLAYQYYNYNERLHSIQNYRANLLTLSLKVSF